MKPPDFLSFTQALFLPHDITGLTSLPEGIYPIYIISSDTSIMKHNTNPIHLIDVYSFGYEKVAYISVSIKCAGMDEKKTILYNVIEYNIKTHMSL